MVWKRNEGDRSWWSRFGTVGKRLVRVVLALILIQQSCGLLDGPGSSKSPHRRFGELGDSLFEYLLQGPASRIGYTRLGLPQLKILQEVITLAVFAPSGIFYMRQPMKLDYLWAGLCLIGAVYFIFRS